MSRLILPICLILATIGLPGPGAQAQSARPAPAAPDRLASFADVAELTLASPVIVRATIARARALPRKAAPDVAPGRARLLVTVAVSNPLLAPAALPASLVFAWDAPLDSRGKPPRVTGMEVLAFLAAPGAGGATRLISRRAVQPWDEALADTVRRVAREARSSDVPDVRGVTSGFRDVGTVAGESESQFFLATTDDRPAVLVVQNRPGEARRVAVARGDIIDESAQPVQPGTLLWYRLACALPARLPAAAGGSDPALARDWQNAIASLGPCGLTG